MFNESVYDLMVIPKYFGAAKENIMDLPVSDMTEVVNTATKVQSFCKERGIDEKRSYFAGLAMEEMVGNIVEHGFSKDDKSHSVGVRVVYKDDHVILRIKDDCTPFDPSERKDMVDPDDITKNIGIRMVYSIAKDISYQHMLGLNILSVKI